MKATFLGAIGGGAGGPVSSESITDATPITRDFLKAGSKAAARAAIDAGTSNLELGYTSDKAKPGSWVPTVSDIDGSGAFGRTLLSSSDKNAALNHLGILDGTALVNLTGAQTITGAKEFTQPVKVGAPTDPNHAARNSDVTNALDRSNHTGYQPASTISDFEEKVNDLLGVRISGILNTGETPPPGSPSGTIWLVREVGSGPAITYVGGSFPNGTTSASTANVMVPAEVQPGDFMLCVWNTADTLDDTPAGWTKLDEITDGPLKTAVYYRIALAGDAESNVAFSPGGYTRQHAAIVAYRGIGSVDQVGKQIVTVNGWTQQTPSITTSDDGCVIVHIVTDRKDAQTTWTVPSGVTKRGEGYRSGAGGKSLVIADDLTQQDSSTTIPARTFTASQEVVRGTMWTISLSPDGA